MSLRELVRSEIRPLTAYAVPRAKDAIHLDANESPWPLPEAARKRLADAVAEVALHRYPDPRADALRALMASAHGGDGADYVFGAGSDELIALLATTLAEPRPPRTRAAILFPGPSFVMYGVSATVQGLEPVEVPLTAAWQLDVPAMKEAIGRVKPNVVFLATPNNPTGNAFHEADLRALIAHDPDALFVIDEAYAAFTGRSLAHLCDAYPNVALMGTLSKFGVAAARVGFIRLPQGLAGEVDKARQPYNMNALSQRVAVLALTELAPVFTEQVQHILTERTRLGDALRAFPTLQTFPTDANFFLVRAGDDADRIVAGLRAKGVIVRHFTKGALTGHIRITVGTPAENDALLSVLLELLP